MGGKSSLKLLMTLSPCIRESEGDMCYLPIMSIGQHEMFLMLGCLTTLTANSQNPSMD